MTMQRKVFTDAIVKAEGLGPRQILVRASNGTKDRVGDVMVPKGCIIRSKTVPFILNHEAKVQNIVGRATVNISDKEVTALVEFLPEGVSSLADDACLKYKEGFATDVSIGFDPIEADREKDGYIFSSWELLELSGVVIGCNPDAVVTGKAQPDAKEQAAMIEHKDRVAKVKAALKTKGMWTVGWFASALGDIAAIEDSVEWEALAENDGSKVPAMLSDALRALADAFLEYAEEEIAELLAEEDDEMVMASLDRMVEKDAEWVVAGSTPAIRKFRAGVIAAKGLNATPVEKAGRKLSKATCEQIKKAVDAIHGGTKMMSDLMEGGEDEGTDDESEDKEFAARVARVKELSVPA